MRRLIKLTESDLHRIIKESIKSILFEGTRMTYKGRVFDYKGDDNKEFKKLFSKFKAQVDAADAAERGEQLPQQQKPKRIRKPKPEVIGDEQASPKALAANIKKLLYEKSLASVKGFKDNGERQFGPNAIKTLVNLFSKEAGEDLFVKFNVIYTGITSTIEEIESWGRKNEYAVYERARKLAYLLQDMDEVLEKMGETYRTLINNKSILNAFGNNANVIIGNGHSLGLSSLIFAKGGSALSKVTGNLLFNANKLMDIADSGRDAFDYDPNNLRRRG